MDDGAGGEGRDTRGKGDNKVGGQHVPGMPLRARRRDASAGCRAQDRRDGACFAAAGGLNPPRACALSLAQAMRSRNYLHANDIYLKLAIGNAPWPIGVTSVGIHERSAREKISHVMNTTSHAHIMNDEATRKYFQVLPRRACRMPPAHGRLAAARGRVA